MNLLATGDVAAWKIWEVRKREWRGCPFVKLKGSVNISEFLLCGELGSLQRVNSQALVPAQILKRDPRFKRGSAVQRPAKKSYRRKNVLQDCLRERDTEFPGCLDEHSETESELESPYEDVRRQLQPSTDSDPLVPYENYVGAILGGQFQLGRLIRVERDGELYSVEPLDHPGRELRAKAYNFCKSQSSELNFIKKSIKKLSRHKVCSIDQAGKKFIVYQAEDNWQPSTGQPRQSKSMITGTSIGRHDQLSATFMSERNSFIATAAISSKDFKVHITPAKPQTGIGSRENADPGNHYNEGKSIMRVIGSEPQVLQTEYSKNETLSENTILPSQEVDQSIKKKKRSRNRGLKKTKVPKFANIPELEKFHDQMKLKLESQQRSLHSVQLQVFQALDKFKSNFDCFGISSTATQHSRSNVEALDKRRIRLMKTITCTLKQICVLSSRLDLASKLSASLDDVCNMVEDELASLGSSQCEDEISGLENLPWRLRKNLPLEPRWVGREKISAPLSSKRQVSDVVSLCQWQREKLVEINGILNGHEAIYRRL